MKEIVEVHFGMIKHLLNSISSKTRFVLSGGLNITCPDKASLMWYSVSSDKSLISIGVNLSYLLVQSFECNRAVYGVIVLCNSDSI